MSDTTMDPKAIAQAVAVTVSDEDGQVGDSWKPSTWETTSPISASNPEYAATKLAMVGHVIP